MPESDVTQIGRHRIWTEEDVFVVVANGPIDGEETDRFNQASLAVFQQYGYVLFLLDASAAAGLSEAARRTAAKFRREHPMPSASAIFGTNLVTRTVAILAFRVLILLRRDVVAEMKMFKTEAEARAWLAGQRPALQAKAATSG